MPLEKDLKREKAQHFLYGRTYLVLKPKICTILVQLLPYLFCSKK